MGIAEGEVGTELWQLVGDKVVPLALKNLTSKPFPDVREQTWGLLTALLPPRPLAQRILTSSEMRDLLLDFTSETSSDPRRAKYEFVCELLTLHGVWIGAFLDENVEKILKE